MSKTIDKWMYYLKYEGSREEDMALKTVFEDNPRLAEAREKYLTFTQDEKLRDACWLVACGWWVLACRSWLMVDY
jgi:hypothetical protein